LTNKQKKKKNENKNKMGKIKKGKNLSFVIIVDFNVENDTNLLATKGWT
jgi:hypothetical protein